MIELPAELVTTQRQWGKSQPVVAPVFADDESDDATWIDSKPPFDSNPPLDEPAQATELPKRFVDAVRTQLVTPPPIEDVVLPRVRASGTGVPGFDLSDSDDQGYVPTGAHPLIATRYEIARASTEPVEPVPPPPALPVGSSPLIAEAASGSPRRVGVARILMWSIVLAAVGLGLGAAITMLVD